ncbi:MAG: 4-hydroxythreonine-4-phosphate dehydrogenase PdxA [Bacteroidaceae bacterium]|nr:4-hydroxythreonine-4-phosphate dehydrogenase PdxA [Prevotellaceae bacterium]MDY5631666.1 4-hydroxythreonine-4-phosphate dehydrogenase PdxA [Bacteroidaceae bacterium]
MERIRVAITQGDTNGVGLEIALKVFSDPTMFELCTPILYANPRITTYHRKACDLTTNFTTINHADEARPDRLNVLVVSDDEVPVQFGQESADAGKQALLALEAAITDFKYGKVDVLVTAPINKHTIQGDGFHFPGHTEYIQSSVGEGKEALMVLMNETMRVALLSTHLPLAQVPQAITEANILEKLQLLNVSLKRDFGIEKPRIAVLGLNPHAGDSGLLGREEQEIIAPAIERAYNELRIHAFGPYAADGFFGAHQYAHYDGILAMYHDQGLAPFKALVMNDGVNFTAGLPLVRTSPDHGTAFDIAGKGVADENSMRQAIFAAMDVYRNRMRFDEANQHPLEELYHKRRENDNPNRRPPMNFAQRDEA